MEQTKSPIQSLTVFAGLLVFALGVFGIVVDVQTAQEALGYVDSVVTAISGLVAIYGRIRANHRIEL